MNGDVHDMQRILKDIQEMLKSGRHEGSRTILESFEKWIRNGRTLTDKQLKAYQGIKQRADFSGIKGAESELAKQGDSFEETLGTVAMARHLQRSLWIQAMDLVALAATTLDERLQRGWTGYRVGHPEREDWLIPIEKEGNRYDYPREIDGARIDAASEELRVTFPKGSGRKNYKEAFVTERNGTKIGDDLIYSCDENGEPLPAFNPGELYQVNDDFQGFDFTILNDIDANIAEYRHWGNWLWNRSADAALCQAARKREKTDADLLEIFSDQRIGLLALQGPPGTGKTTFIADLVEKWLAAGVAPGNISCLAQTRRAAAEIFRKLQERSGMGGPLRPDLLPATSNDPIEVGKIYIGTLFKSPHKARQHRRKFVLVDEVSQIALPQLFYALRFARQDNPVIRFFGDQEQLAPTTTYVRDLGKIPQDALQDLRNRWFAMDREGDYFFDQTVAALAGRGVGNGAVVVDDLCRPDYLRKLGMEHIRSPAGQSIFSLTEFDPVKNSTDARVERLLDGLRTCRFTKHQAFRQEPVLHDLTSRVFYPDLGDRHVTVFPRAATNLHDAVHLARSLPAEKAAGLFGHLTAGETTLLHGLVSTVARRGRKRRSISRREVQLELPFGDAEKEQLEKDVVPFATRGKDELVHECLAFLNHGESRRLLERSGLASGIEALAACIVPALCKQVIVVCHGAPCQGSAPRNDLEVVLAGLFLHLWRDEPFRVAIGLGAVTPFRLQETAIQRFVRQVDPALVERLSSDQQGQLDDGRVQLGERHGRLWCATPERYQGRDLSRVVVSLVLSSNEPFLDPSSMFTKNKLNVATSRAGSQQALIGHRAILSEKSLADFEVSIEKLDEPGRSIVRTYPLAYRRKLAAYVEACRKDARCAVVDLPG